MKCIKLDYKKYEKLKNICVGISIVMAFGIMACSGIIVEYMPVFSKLPGLVFVIFVFALAMVPYLIYIQLFYRIFETDYPFAADV